MVPPAADASAPILVIDIGGSSVKSALVRRDIDGWLLAERFDVQPVTSRSFDALRALVVAGVARGLQSAPHLGLVGISTTGSADAANVVLGAAFFEGYENISWKDVFGDAFPSRSWRVRVVNDGRAAAWGTHLEDAIARGRSLAHFVVGTGVGGGVVIDGRLVHGAHNFAGVLGHIRVTDRETPPCVCGRHGCVEQYAAAPALLRAAEAAGLGPAASSIEALAGASRAGSTDAQDVFRAAGAWLGRAIAVVANVLDPDVITIGGGVVAAADAEDGARNWYVDAAATSARDLALPRIAARVRVVRASLLNDAALIGAAALAAAEAR